MTGWRLGLVIVAAGSATRMDGIDKVWTPLGPHPVIWYSLRALARHAERTVVVVRPAQLERAEREIRATEMRVTVVPGGDRRQVSVQHGISALAGVDVVAIHDAARPFVSEPILDQGIRLLSDCEGAVPVVPVGDTVKKVNSEGAVTATLDRVSLRLAQTPQVFKLDALHEARKQVEAQSGSTDLTDDAMLLEMAGFRVQTYAGSPLNFKITTRHDLEIARLLVGASRNQ